MHSSRRPTHHAASANASSQSPTNTSSSAEPPSARCTSTAPATARSYADDQSCLANASCTAARSPRRMAMSIPAPPFRRGRSGPPLASHDGPARRPPSPVAALYRHERGDRHSAPRPPTCPRLPGAWRRRTRVSIDTVPTLRARSEFDAGSAGLCSLLAEDSYGVGRYQGPSHEERLEHQPDGTLGVCVQAEGIHVTGVLRDV